PWPVAADSVLQLNRGSRSGTVTSSRTWQGPINVSSGATLTLRSTNPDNVQVRFRMPGNLSGSTGTFKIADVNATVPTNVTLENTVFAGSATATFDTGVGNSILDNNYSAATTIQLGGLSGGATTFLRGSNSSNANITDTYSIGAKGIDTMFQGQIFNGTAATNTHTTA